MTTRLGWKLLKLRKDGTLGPLFINARQRIEVGVEYQAEKHPTAGYAYRPGWHACAERSAPHLTKGKAAESRVWARVSLQGVTEHHRPASQGGVWFTAESMTVLSIS